MRGITVTVADGPRAARLLAEHFGPRYVCQHGVPNHGPCAACNLDIDLELMQRRLRSALRSTAREPLPDTCGIEPTPPRA